MSKLILHAGAHAATMEQVQNVITPQATSTHVPIPHAMLIALVTGALESKGLMVREQEYGLWGPQSERMFGLLTLSNSHNAADYALTLGIRNAHDKRFPAAGAIGSRVFVCDNLAFSGEITFGRKHTARIVQHLPQIVDGAVERLIQHRGYQDRRIAAYKAHNLLSDGGARAMEGTVHDSVIRMYDANIIPCAKIDDVLREWRTPRHPEFEDRTVWALFNAVTEALKGTPTLLPARTTRLHSLCDSIVGFARIAENTNVDNTVEADYEIVEEGGDDVADPRLN